MRVIIRKAKISRSTLYRHHNNIYEIIPDYEEYILKKYYGLMRGLMRKKEIRLKTLYYQMLIFIFKNKNVFKVVTFRGNGRLIEKMIEKLEPKIIDVYRLPKNCDEMLKIYRKEIAGLVEEWIEKGVDCDEINKTLASIMNLTVTMRQRLKVLLG